MEDEVLFKDLVNEYHVGPVMIITITLGMIIALGCVAFIICSAITTLWNLIIKIP